MKKSLFSTILAILAIVLCAPYLAAQDKTLKVGIVAPFTGPQAYLGAEYRTSTEMAMENINYKIGDYKLEMVWIDDQCDPAKATSAYAEAVENHGIDVGALGWCSSVNVALMDLAADYRVPHIFTGGSTPLINEKYHSNPEKYSYFANKNWPMPISLMGFYVEALETAIAKGDWKPAKKTFAIFGEDTDMGRGHGGGMKELFLKAGWELVSEDFFPNTQTDFYSLLNRYRSNQVALIAGTANYPAMGAFIKQAREVELKSAIIADGMGWTGNWYEQTGEAAEGVLDMIPQLATPEAKAWAEKFEARAGFKPSASAGGLCAYDGAGIMIKILNRTLEKHGKLDKVTIHEVLKNEWLTGKLSYTKADGAIIMNSYRYTSETTPDPVVGLDDYFFPVLQYDRDGGSHIIYPASLAVTGFKAP